MYESIIKVDVGSDPNLPRKGRQWFRDRYRIHQRLWMAFADETLPPGPAVKSARDRASEEGLRFLYRTVPCGEPYIIVRSTHEPNWWKAFKNAAFLLKDDLPTVHAMALDFAQDRRYYFSLVANPTVSKKFEGRERGARVGIVEEAALKAWFVRQGAAKGFSPLEYTARNLGTIDAWKSWNEAASKPATPQKRPDGKPEKRCRMHFNAARFDGVLEVTDTAKFIAALGEGIGPAKAFGFGMLCVGNRVDTP
jgi:CRISPR system Cascade subunit CasE